MKQNLLVCSILNFILIAINFLTDSNFIGLNRILILFATGVYLYILSNKSNLEIKKSNNMLIVIGVILLFINPLSSIIILLTSDQMKKVNVLEENIVKKKKNNLLFNTGIFLILLSVLIFFNTSFENLPSIFKVLTIFTISISSFIISEISNKYFKLITVSKILYYVGIILTMTCYYLLGDLNLLGNITNSQEGILLFNSSLYLLGALLSYITYKKYMNNIFSNVSKLLILIGSLYLLKYFAIDLGIILFLINLLFFIMILRKNNKNILVAFNILVLAMFINYINSLSNIYLVINTLMIIFSNLLMVNKKTNSNFSFICGMIINLVIVFGFSFLNIPLPIKMTLSIILLAIINNFIIYTKSLNGDESFTKTYTYISNILMLFIFSICLTLEIELNLKFIFIFMMIISSLLIFISSLLNYLLAQKNNHSKLNLLIVNSLPVVIVVSKYLFLLSYSNTLLLIIINYLILMIILRKTKAFEFCAVITLTSLFNLGILNLNSNNIYIIIAVLLVSLVIFILSYKVKNRLLNSLSIPILTYFLIMVYYTLNGSIFNYNKLILLLITLFIYIVIVIMLRKQKHLFLFSNFMLSLPLLNIVFNYINDNDITFIITTLFIIYLLYITVNKLVSKIETKDLVIPIILTLVLAVISLQASILLVLFTLIISLTMILVGLIKTSYKNTLIVGVIFTLINVLKHLEKVLIYIPFWCYLLLIGIILIIIVVYKETKKID